MTEHLPLLFTIIFTGAALFGALIGAAVLAVQP
jgi:hypothetical protein